MSFQRIAAGCAGLLAAGLLLACPSQPESGQEQALTPTAPASPTTATRSTPEPAAPAQTQGAGEPAPRPDTQLPAAPAPVAGSILDEVEVMGADEAALEAERAIGDGNVLDVLDELAREIESGGN